MSAQDVKSGSGLQAVAWAREGEWDLLEEYCMQDTILTHEISCVQAGRVNLPLSLGAGTAGTFYFEHEFCREKNEHKRLDFFWER